MNGCFIFVLMLVIDDLVCKIVLIRVVVGLVDYGVEERLNNDNIVFWIGEKFGMVSFMILFLWNEDDFKDF